ncbi:MAG: glycosyltransferase [Myxococcota bacterium]
MRALIIAYLFPPLGGPGVQRTVSFVRHLPSLGWSPTVIAAHAPGYWARDESLLGRIPASVRVRRVAEGALARGYGWARRLAPREVRADLDATLLVPDRQAPWGYGAFVAALLEARRGRPDVVFATGAPWTNLLVGAAVARVLQRPLVVDLRDPWTDSTVFTPASPAHRWVHKGLETRVYRSASHVIANTPGNLEEMKESFPITRGKSSVIPNGWDSLDFMGLRPVAPPSGRLWVGYAGNFYAGRRPREVLELFARARDRSDLVRSQLRLRFVGNTAVADDAQDLGLSEVVQELGYRPLREALGLLAGCDATLVTVPADARPGWVPQKLYQQLRLGRPILTLAPEGDAATLTREAGQLWVDVRAPDAPRRLARALERVHAGDVSHMPAEVIWRFDRARLSSQLARVLDSVRTVP